MNDGPIHIQDPLGQRRGFFGGASKSDGPADSGGEQPKVFDPLAGFGNRVVAFLIDAVILNFFARLWAPAGYEFFVEQPEVLYLLAWGVPVAYFTLLNGRLGDGQTVGKRLIGIATRGRDGAPLDWRRALARSVVQTAPIAGFVFPTLLYRWFEPGLPTHRALFWGVCLVEVPLVAFLMTNAALVAFRRDKLGAHDLVAGSYSHKNLAAADAPAWLAAITPSMNARGHVAAAILGIVVLGLFETNVVMSHASMMEHARLVGRVYRAYPLEGFGLHLRLYEPRPAMATAGDGETDATTTTGARTTDGETTNTAADGPDAADGFLLVLYARLGRVVDAKTLAAIERDDLTTGVARWFVEHRDEPEVARLLTFNTPTTSTFTTSPTATADKPTTGPPRLPPIRVEFQEALWMPFFIGPSQGRLVHHAIFPNPLSEEEIAE